MKRRLLLAIVAFAIAIIGFSAPTHVAQAACVTASGTGSVTGPFQSYAVQPGDVIKATNTALNVDHWVYILIIANGTSYGTGWVRPTGTLNVPVTLAGTAQVQFYGANPSLTVNAGSYNWTVNIGTGCQGKATDEGTKWFEPNDDRANREAGAPAVLYCRNKGDIHIYKVEADTSWGKIALVVTKAQIDAVVNSNPTSNTLIKQSADGSVKVFYLPATKEFSLIAKDSRPPYKPYSFVWKGCA